MITKALVDLAIILASGLAWGLIVGLLMWWLFNREDPV